MTFHRDCIFYIILLQNNLKIDFYHPYPVYFEIANLSVIRQKGKSQNGCNKRTKHAKFSEKHFLPPDTYICDVSGGKKCLFFGKFGVLYFLVTSVLRFALLLYHRRINVIQLSAPTKQKTVN